MAKPTLLGSPGSASATAIGAGDYVTFTYTVSAGNNRSLFLSLGVGAGYTNGVIASAVSYGGQAMTEVGHVGDTVFMNEQIWYLKEAGIAAATTNVFTITFPLGGNDLVVFGAVAWQDCDQGTTIGTPTTTFSNSITPSTGSINLSADQVAMAAVATDDNDAFTSNATQLYQIIGVGGSPDIGGAAEYITATGALTWTTDATNWAVVGVPINGISGVTSLPRKVVAELVRPFNMGSGRR